MTDQHQVEILLVEDDSADAELTLRAFKARNFANQVFVARDGAEALDFFFGDGSHPLRDIGVVPKVVLLDLKLPKVDGLEVLRRLRADDRTRRIPVVILTSSREEPDIAAAYRLVREQLHRQAGGLRGVRARRVGGRAVLAALERAAALGRAQRRCRHVHP